MEESIKLAFKEGSSDKVYHVELKAEADGYVVNFAYGRRGNTLNTGTKTANPVDLETAKKAYDKLVKSKVAKGYKAEDESDLGIKVIVDKTDTGVRVQLLNEIDEVNVDKYLTDDRYCMQEKDDGRRKAIKYTGSTVIGINKKGFETPVIPTMEADIQKIQGAALLDGEDMGEYIRLFDLLSFSNMRYEDRYMMLKELIPLNAHTLQVVETAFSTTTKVEMFNKLKQNKAEGVVFKLKDAPYTPGRPASGGSQYKCKFYETASCIVSSHSTTKRSVVLHVLDDEGSIVPVGNVTIYPNQDIPAVGEVVEIKYLYFYPGGSLYQPVFKEVRDDVDKEECLLSKLKTKRETV